MGQARIQKVFVLWKLHLVSPRRWQCGEQDKRADDSRDGPVNLHSTPSRPVHGQYPGLEWAGGRAVIVESEIKTWTCRDCSHHWRVRLARTVDECYCDYDFAD